MAIEGILFDCDGVIIDTDTTYRKMVTDILNKEYGYDISLKDAIERWKGKNANQIARELAFEGCDFADDFVHRVHEASTSYTINEDIIVPNLRKVLEEFKDLPKGVCSNGRQSRITRNLEQVNLLDEFDFIQGRDSSGLMKPDPEVFIKGAETLGVDIKNCIVIEDSPLGLQAAINSGATAVAFYGTSSKKEDLEKLNPHYLIEDLAQLIDIINSINNQ